MTENCKVYNLESFTDEERELIEELINQIEEKKKTKKKWWIVPKYNVFSEEVREFGQSYIVEPQEDVYSKSRPPLKTDFDSEEEAEKWLKDYLEKESLFKSAEDEVNNLICNLGYIIRKLQKHEYITQYAWDDCFRLYNESKVYGALFRVTKEE